MRLSQWRREYLINVEKRSSIGRFEGKRWISPLESTLKLPLQPPPLLSVRLCSLSQRFCVSDSRGVLRYNSAPWKEGYLWNLHVLRYYTVVRVIFFKTQPLDGYKTCSCENRCWQPVAVDRLPNINPSSN